MTELSLTEFGPSRMAVDAVVVATVPSSAVAKVGSGRAGRPEAERTARVADGQDLPPETLAALDAALAVLGAKGSADEVVRLPHVPGIAAPVVVLTGLGRPNGATYGLEQLRRAAGAATRTLSGAQTVGLAMGGRDAAQRAAVAEGALLGAYRFLQHKGTPSPTPALKTVLLTAERPRDKDVKAAAKRVQTVVDAQLLVRDLVNAAPNRLYPESFADIVRERGEREHVEVEVMDEKALAKAGLGGVVCVGRGSDRPPRVVTMRYVPRRTSKHVALVGKGVTFDSGGLWIKPGASMVTMKSDMAGAAVVAATVLAAAQLRLPVKVTGYLCLAENMLGGAAMRPGDVISTRSGKTVEIINPDAEGRLVLMDGLELASEQRPDAIVDIATLTGMAVVALGHRTGGLLGSDEQLEQALADAAGSVGELVQRMPILEEARATLDSSVADIKHHGEREGGMQIAARFLQEFVGDGEDGPIPWAHLDIAGPAFNEKPGWGYTPKGGTGYGVRTLLAYLADLAG